MSDPEINALKYLHQQLKEKNESLLFEGNENTSFIGYLHTDGTYKKLLTFSESDIEGDGIKEPVVWIGNGKCVSLINVDKEDFYLVSVKPIF